MGGRRSTDTHFLGLYYYLASAYLPTIHNHAYIHDKTTYITLGSNNMPSPITSLLLLFLLLFLCPTVVPTVPSISGTPDCWVFGGYKTDLRVSRPAVKVYKLFFLFLFLFLFKVRDKKERLGGSTAAAAVTAEAVVSADFPVRTVAREELD